MTQEQTKQELQPENMKEVSGGAQVKLENVVTNNQKSVKIGSTVVINM